MFGVIWKLFNRIEHCYVFRQEHKLLKSLFLYQLLAKFYRSIHDIIYNQVCLELDLFFIIKRVSV